MKTSKKTVDSFNKSDNQLQPLILYRICAHYLTSKNRKFHEFRDVTKMKLVSKKIKITPSDLIDIVDNDNFQIPAGLIAIIADQMIDDKNTDDKTKDNLDKVK